MFAKLRLRHPNTLRCLRNRQDTIRCPDQATAKSEIMVEIVQLGRIHFHVLLDLEYIDTPGQARYN